MTELSDREVLAILGELATFIPHKSFTKVQARCIPNIVQRNEHVIVAAPTGSGKTLLMEVAIVKLFKSRLLQHQKCNKTQEPKVVLPSESMHKVQKCKRREAADEVLEYSDWQKSQVAEESIFNKNCDSNTNNVDNDKITETNVNSNKMKAVYICPMKALANEKFNSWTELFPSLSVVIETGDQDMSYVQEEWNDEERLERISDADIIITTPERWDSITRRWKESQVFAIVNTIGLLLLDEVHTIHEERGAALEAVVSRMKVIINEVNQTNKIGSSDYNSSSSKNSENITNKNVSTTKNAVLQTRFIAISGTLPNVDDFAEWLHVPADCVFTFTQADRPVPLSIRVLPFRSNSNNPYAFDRFISFKLSSLIKEYSSGRPTLIFCASRRDAVNSAQRIASEFKTITECEFQARQQPHQLTWPYLCSTETQHLIQSIKDKELRRALSVGVGFHHAALTLEDRQCVESMFRNGHVAVLCATTTLSLGVNLPAHLVMIKGTTFFNRGVRSELPLSEVAQMCGRAGRPGLDTHGMALILTTTQAAATYQPLALNSASINNYNYQFNNCNSNNNNKNNAKSQNNHSMEIGVATTAESQLHRHMIEHVNAEVALRTIHNFESAIAWVETTFFWTRLAKCPVYYGLQFTSETEAAAFKPLLFVEKLMERVLLALADAGCITLSHQQAQLSEWVSSKTTMYTSNDTYGVSDNKATTPFIQIDRVALIESTRLGRAMSRLYILFETVCLFDSELYLKSNKIASNNEDDNDDKCGTDIEGTETDENKTSEKLGNDNGNDDDDDNVNTNESKRCLSMWGLQSSRVSLPQVLEVLSKCEEFVEVRLRQGDKGPLNEINKLVRFPIHGGRKGGREVREDWHKVYLIIQCQLSQITINDISLRNDATRAWTLLPRLARFLHLFVSYMNMSVASINNNNNNNTATSDNVNAIRKICNNSEKVAQQDTFSLFVQTHLLQRCVQRRVWHDGLVLRQLSSVTDAVAKILIESKVHTFADIRAIDPHKLEILCGKPPPFGTIVCNEVRSLPHCVSISVTRVDDKCDKEHATWPNNKCSLNICSSNIDHDNNNCNNVCKLTTFKANKRVPLTHLMLQQRRALQYCITLEFEITNNDNNMNNGHNTGEPIKRNKYPKVERSHNVLLVVGDMVDDRILLRREFALPVMQTDSKNTNANTIMNKYTSNHCKEKETTYTNNGTINNDVTTSDDSFLYKVEYTFTIYKKQMQNSKLAKILQKETQEEEKENAEVERDANTLSRLSAYVLTEHIVGNDMMVRLSECPLHRNINSTSHDKLNIKIIDNNGSMHKNDVRCSAFDAFCDDLRMIEKNASRKVNKQNSTKQLEKCTIKKNGMANKYTETTTIDTIEKKEKIDVKQCRKELSSNQDEIVIRSSVATAQKEVVQSVPLVMTKTEMMVEDARIDDDSEEKEEYNCKEEFETSIIAVGEECNLNLSNCSEAEAAFTKTTITNVKQSNTMRQTKPVHERNTLQSHKEKQCINERSNEVTSIGRCNGVVKNTIQLPPCPPSPEPVCFTRNDVQREVGHSNFNININKNCSNVHDQFNTTYATRNFQPDIRCQNEGQHTFHSNRMHVLPPQVQISEPLSRHRFHFGVNDKPITPSHKLNSYFGEETTHVNNNYLPSRQSYLQRAHETPLSSPPMKELIPVDYYNNRVQHYPVIHETRPRWSYNAEAAKGSNVMYNYDNIQHNNYYSDNINNENSCEEFYSTRNTPKEICTSHIEQLYWAEEFMQSCRKHTSPVASPTHYERYDTNTNNNNHYLHRYDQYCQNHSNDRYNHDRVHSSHTPNITYNAENVQFRIPKGQQQQQYLPRLSSLSAVPAALGKRQRKRTVTRD